MKTRNLLLLPLALVLAGCGVIEFAGAAIWLIVQLIFGAVLLFVIAGVIYYLVTNRSS